MAAVAVLHLVPGIRHKMVGSRFLHVSQRLVSAGKSTSNLAKLRKSTGFALSNCKKALEMHDSDITKAEEWLHAEAQAQGWSKANKLKSRATTQGLVGIHINGPIGAVIEINCETDFVARNEQFKSLVVQAAKECALNANSSPQDTLIKELISEEKLKAMVVSDGKTLADHLALLIGIIGENMSLARAARVIAPDGVQLVGYSHPSTPDAAQLLGRLGTILALKCPDTSTDVVKELCVHIVGMNPTAIGNPDDPKAEKSEEETLLVHQEFITDESKTVGEVLQEENIEVVDFIRFECGELGKNDE